MLQGFQHVCTDNIYQEFLCFNADEGATKLAMRHFIFPQEAKLSVKAKNYSPIPTSRKSISLLEHDLAIVFLMNTLLAPVRWTFLEPDHQCMTQYGFC